MPSHSQPPLSALEVATLAVIATLVVALVLPQVYQAGIDANQRQCAKNQHQLALALQAFESQHNRLPGWCDTMIAWDDKAQATPTPVSWAWKILPYIEQGEIYRAGTTAGSGTFNAAPWSWPKEQRDPHVKLFVCPEDAAALESRSSLSYVVNTGVRDDAPRSVDAGPGATVRGVFYHDTAAGAMFFNNYPNPKVLASKRPAERLVYQTLTVVAAGDGASNTMLLSENVDATTWTARDVNGDLAEGDVGFCFADVRRPGPQNMLAMNALPIGKVDPKRRDAPRASSHHPAGANVTFADGHTVFIKDRIHWVVWCLLFTPRGDSMFLPSTKWQPERGELSVFAKDLLKERF